MSALLITTTVHDVNTACTNIAGNFTNICTCIFFSEDEATCIVLVYDFMLCFSKYLQLHVMSMLSVPMFPYAHVFLVMLEMDW